jgi:hypothetical protein
MTSAKFESPLYTTKNLGLICTPAAREVEKLQNFLAQKYVTKIKQNGTVLHRKNTHS